MASRCTIKWRIFLLHLETFEILQMFNEFYKNNLLNETLKKHLSREDMVKC